MTRLNFDTQTMTFRQLLGNGVTYQVPPFQRDYAWGEDEWEDIWQDINTLFEEEGETAHYMGYLVLQSSDYKHFTIIDGQQRITTLSLLILAGLSLLQDLITADIDSQRNQRRQQQLQNSYIGDVDPVSLLSYPKLQLNRHSNRFYQTYLVPLDRIPNRGLNGSERQLRKAFFGFKDRLQERQGLGEDRGQEIAKFVDVWVDKLVFTVITVTDELNAFKVFETLNARGVRLSSTDLLKNYLFSLLSQGDRHPLEVESLELFWERIVGLLGQESFPEFLRIFWNRQYPLVRKRDLFKTLKRQITTREQGFALLRSLDRCAEIYTALQDVQDVNWTASEKRSLQALRLFETRQSLSFLIACYERFFESDRPVFTRILKAISVISFRYSVICGLPNYDQERRYNNIARRIHEGTLKPSSDVFRELRSLTPEDKPFKAAFINKCFPTFQRQNKQIVRYILFNIEKQNYGREFDLESASYTLEHILPEHPGADWDDLDDSQQEQLRYRLGNLTLLEASLNRQVGNQGYPVKRDIYAESRFGITQAIAEQYDEWNGQKIESRQRQLANIAAGIWRFEFP
ncbi:DUF262 domain-containing HNH endonuclease family protein [Phormidium yuhuli AB48]|uniref:DUF262 domain-containing HNH endonuclease family protein n=1 Tax=Phormidium yuhuli AB48 TaxID=2940671 RepID=A0ABY5AV97_9CYAN|nr:DUF262 domain-containing protein [Phormidium yuhuli]USR92043.1 DUF262 domain-containing HNH endonuclease family protein [Phormidium yuhuli AB48]